MCAVCKSVEENTGSEGVGEYVCSVRASVGTSPQNVSVKSVSVQKVGG